MLSPPEAFQIAVPRRPAVLCLKRGGTARHGNLKGFGWAQHVSSSRWFL